ncbi:MAG TPA: hemolysin III family protein [Actinomycetota bacterium]|nr:hemolysin III family protein [Actinomycetota bacterium]
MDRPLAPEKPRWRGRIHEVAFFVSIPAGLALVALADGWVARVAAAVYALSLIAVFGSSAAYHRGDWTPAALRRMKRLDHSMIFVLIAGSYTPVALLVLHGSWSVVILSVVWAGAVAGITLKLVRIDGFSVLTATLYMTMGWLALVAIPQLVNEMPPAALILTVVGGLLYTAGAIVFALRRPDPAPSIFGYHEVWHAFMVAAAACHFAMISILVLQ